jgi:hypothetical protein
LRWFTEALVSFARPVSISPRVTDSVKLLDPIVMLGLCA